MSDQIVFYTHPMSRGRIIRWLLEEVGQPYETQMLDFDAMKNPAYLAVNPMGKVPAVKHGDTVITECAAICAYMADAFPDANLAPPVGSKLRGDYYRWLFFAAGPLEQAVTNKSAGFEPSAEKSRMFGYGSYDLAVNTLAGHLASSDYVCGDRFTAADVYVGSQVMWGTQFATLPSFPSFLDYGARLSGRAAYKRGKDIDGKLIAELQAAAS